MKNRTSLFATGTGCTNSRFRLNMGWQVVLLGLIVLSSVAAVAAADGEEVLDVYDLGILDEELPEPVPSEPGTYDGRELFPAIEVEGHGRGDPYGAVPGGPVGEAIALTAGGEAAALIVLPHDAGSLERQAGRTLQAFIRRMSGAELPKWSEDELEGVEVDDGAVRLPADWGATNLILLGAGRLTAALGIGDAGLGPGGIRLKTFDNGVALIGGPERLAGEPGIDGDGLRYATIELLERLGVRYLWPGELGFVIPTEPDIHLQPLDYQYTPPVRGRFVRYREGRLQSQTRRGMDRIGITPAEWRAGYEKAMGDAPGFRKAADHDFPPLWGGLITGGSAWTDWHRFSRGGLPRFGHAGAGLRDGAEFVETHPEWFAKQASGTRWQAGQSRWRLCKSNEELIAHVAEDIIARRNDDPSLTLVSLDPNDGSGMTGWCQCEQCKALDPDDAPTVRLYIFPSDESRQGRRVMVDHPSLTDRHLHYWNRIAERVTEVHPDMLFGISAYSRFSHPPVVQPVHPSHVVRYVRSNIGDDLERLLGWRDAGAQRMFWRPNLLQGSRRRLIIHAGVGALSENIRTLVEEGGMIQTDIDSFVHNWAMLGINYYAIARLLWDPRLSPEEIIRDYAYNGFGDGGAYVERYFHILEVLSQRRSMTERFTSDVADRLRVLLRRAETAADDPVIAERIAFLRLALNMSELQTRLHQKSNRVGFRVDGAQQRRLQDLNVLAIGDIALNHNLAVDTGYFYQRTAHVGGRAISDPVLLERIRDPAYGLTGREEGLEDMLRAFGLLQLEYAGDEWTPTYTAIWTGEGDNERWYNERNWIWENNQTPPAQPLSEREHERMGFDFNPDHPVMQVIPDAETRVVFTHRHQPTDFIDLTYQASASREVGALLFKGDMPAQPLRLDRAGGGSMNWTVTDGLFVESGAPAIQINLGASGQLSSADELMIVNDSAERLRLGGRMSTNYRIAGSGPVEVTGTTLRGSGYVILDENFSGTFFAAAVLQPRDGVGVSGGTLHLQHAVHNEIDRFAVEGGVLTGTGRIGVARYRRGHAREGANRIVVAMDATVNPGGIGQAGLLTFKNYPVDFEAGSVLQVDMIRAGMDADGHPLYGRLRFDRHDESFGRPTLALDEGHEGVALALNLLEGFNAEPGDLFVIVEGFGKLKGQFAGLADGETFAHDGYQFEIRYGEESIVLEVLARPQI